LNDTSVASAADKVEKLAAALKKLSGSIQIDFNAGGGTKSIGTAMKEMAAKLAKESKGDIDEAVKKMTQMRGAAPFGAGTRSVPGFKAAAKGMGVENAFKLFFQELDRVDPQGLRKALDDGSVMMMQENREIKQKFDKIQSSAEGLAKDLRAMGEAAQATGRASLSDGGKTLYPQNYGLKIASLLGQIEKLEKELRKVSAESGVELLDNLKELSYALRATSNSFVGIAGFSDTLDATLKGFNAATQAAARATNAYTERIRRRGGVEYGPAPQRLLLSSPLLSLREMGENMARQYRAPSREVKGLLPAGGKTPGEAITEAYISELRRSFKPSIAGLLSPATGRVRPPTYLGDGEIKETREQMLARRTAEAYARSAFREMAPPVHFTQQRRLSGTTFMGDQFTAGGGRDSVRGTGQPPQRGGALSFRQTPLTSDYYKNAFRYSEALKVADASMRNFSASQIPFIGGLRGVAGELGQATKQVLLYGTAYRALAAITAIPGQILNAAKSQQQYTNGLKVATQETGTFAKELLFVDNVQRAFGLNLETTRTGFTRLYASMAPTGFDSGSIEKLFTGISAATAALQLTPDKAERVIYAFGQMASKGQIMSEELKGQLGDVLPGALAIFAKSAGMSVKEFSKAMEDGEFVGNRFREVFAKVSDELMTRFGTGAQAAGKSLQGLLSTVGGDFQRTLESFAPLANSVAQAILVPLGGALRQLSTSAQIAMGEMDRVKGQYKAARIDLGDLRAGGASADQIRAAEQNVAALEARYKSLNKALEDPAIAKQVKDIQLFTQELTKAGIFVMNVARTIGGILSPAINFLGTNLTATIATITSFYIGFQTARLAAMALMGVLLLYRGISTMLGLSTAAQQATALSGAFNVLGVSASRANISLIQTRVALTALVAATVVGAVVAGIVAIASAFATMGDKARDAAQASKDAGKAAMDAASTGNVAGAEMGVQAVLAESRKNTAARKALEAIQRRSTVDQRKGAWLMDITSEESVALQGSALTAGMVKGGVSRGGIRQIQALSKELAQTTLEQFGSLAGQVAIDLKEAKAAVGQARKVSAETGLNRPTPDPATGADDVDLAKAKKAAADAARALNERQNLADKLSSDQTKTDIERQKTLFENEKSMINMAYDLREARANSFQKETIRFQRELFNIEMERQKAVLDANSAVTKAQGAVAGGTGGATGLLQGSTGISSAAHFDVRRQDGGYISPQQARALFEASVAKQLQLTSTYGPRKAPVAGASTFHRGVDLAGPANTPLNLAQGYSMVGAGMKGGLGYTASVRGPQGEMYDVGHLQQPRAGVPSGKVTGRQKRIALADQQTENALQDTKVKTTLAEAEALKKAEIAMVNYISSIAPVAEQDLQNQLLGKRIELMQSGVPEAFAETQMKIFEAQEKVRMAGEQLDLTNQKQVEAYEKLKQSLPGYIALLEDAAVKQQQLGFTKTMKDLGDRAAMARALTPEAEMRTRLQQQGYAGTQLETLFETEKATAKAEQLKTQMQGVASTIGDAFSTAFQGIINGSMSAQEALGNFFQSVGQSFVKMAMDIIAKQMVMIVLGFLMKALGLSSGGGLGSAKDNMAKYAPLPEAANGAIFSNGIAKFANGGIVNGPTLFPFADGGAMQMGLMGEAGPEAIMPLQRGPDGALGVRAAMGGNGMGGSSSSILNMSFETSTINGVEYVSRDQLELAMAQTRRQASRDGANKGMAMTLDKIQQSPQTRRRIGM
jgi:tape measure domain-containing protein